MVEQAHWLGTNTERDELLRAIERNCTCDPEHTEPCGSHSIFASRDAQRVLDGLLFMRRIADRLRAEERRYQTLRPEHV